MIDYMQLPIGSNAPQTVNAVVEIPADSVNKYEYDKKLHVFRLDRNLFSPVHYPGDYGFIPSTLSQDGDALDVLILVASPSFTGCLIEVRPVAMLEMRDQGMADEKILAVAVQNPRYQEVDDYDDVYQHRLKEIQHFFTIYKDLEGKRMQIGGWHNAEVARRVIQESHERYLHSAKAERTA